MRENVTISYRGAGYEIGRAEHFYGIWAASSSQSQPLEWWPATAEGWSGAWSRFTALEAPGTITPVGPVAQPVAASGLPGSGPPGSGPPGSAPLAGLLSVRPGEGRSAGAVAAAALLAVGVLCGFAGLFPSYLSGGSLAHDSAELVPHVIYLAAWAGSAVLILLGGVRLRAGALLGLAASVVTFGFFLADAGTPISGGAHLMGAGLVLGLVGWLLCAAGSALACRLRPLGWPGRPRSEDMGPVVMLMLAALGTAVAFAPPWDSYTLRNAAGTTQSIALGNAFANPAPVIAGNVAVMVALVAVVAAAALWRPTRLGAALLAGAIIPMAAEAISALIEAGQVPSPTQFGLSPAQAGQIGLTISSGLTPAFWIYCAFLVALLASLAWMLIPPHQAAPTTQRLPQPPWAGARDASVPGTAETSGQSAGREPGDPAAPAPDTADTADTAAGRPPASSPGSATTT